MTQLSHLVVLPATQQVASLTEMLAQARHALREAEALLAQEQAAVNAFRLQCHLKLGEWIEQFLELRAQQQTYLTRLQLQEQAHAFGLPFEDEIRFWQTEIPASLKEELAQNNLFLSDTADTTPSLDQSALKRLYRELARRFHPDYGDDAGERAYRTTMMTAVNQAYASKNIALLQGLAGELDPETVSYLTGGQTLEIRRLKKSLLTCKKRQRRVWQQFQVLRRETTAQLWRRAQQLEANGLNWWEELQTELHQLSQSLQQEVETLQQQVQKQDSLI